MCHNFFVAAIKKKQTNKNPEQPKKAEHCSQISAMTAGSTEHIHKN